MCSPDLVQHCPLVHPEDLQYHTLLHTDTRKHAWHDWLRLAGVTGVDPTAGQRFETFLLSSAGSRLRFRGGDRSPSARGR